MARKPKAEDPGDPPGADAPTIEDYQRLRQAIIDHMDANDAMRDPRGGTPADRKLWSVLDHA